MHSKYLFVLIIVYKLPGLSKVDSRVYGDLFLATSLSVRNYS